MRCLCVVGLPGSSKTFLAKELCDHNGWLLLDDPRDPSHEILKAAARDNRDIVITDPVLCKSTSRYGATKLLSSLGYEVEYLYFENDPEACIKNVERRNDGRNVLSFIHHMTKEYKIPPNAVVLPVYRPMVQEL